MNHLRSLRSRKADLVTSLFFGLLGVLMTWFAYEFVSIAGTSTEPLLMTITFAIFALVFYGLALLWAMTERRPIGPDSSELCFVWSSKEHV